MTEKRTHLVTSEPSREGAIADIRALSLTEKALVEIKPQGVTRGLKANRLAFLWFKEIGQQAGESAHEVRRYCKLTFGLPILMYYYDDADDLAEWWDRIAADMDYETQLESMDWIEVTRRFTTRQFAQFLNEIENFYVPKGIQLSHPSDLYFDALMKEVE